MESPHTSRPRQVSFSEVMPSGLSMSMAMTSSTSSAVSSSSSTSSASASKSSKTRSLPRSPAPPKIRPAPACPATPPLQSSTRSYVRSPYVPSHVRGESTGGDSDVFGEDPPGWSVTPPAFSQRLRDATGHMDKENQRPGTPPKLKIMSPAWGVPRSPEGSETGNAPSPSPSPSHRKSALPRLDFSRTGTPLTARKPFTPRRLQPESPTRVLGRKISLHGIGTAYAEKEKGPMMSSRLACDDDDDDETSSFGDEEDADAVDLALDLASLSVSSVSKPPSTPTRPVAVGDMFSPSPPEHPSILHSTRTSPNVSVTFSEASFIDMSGPSPSATKSTPLFSRSSSLPLPPPQMPSAPSTPAAAATGYDSDESDIIVPRTGRRPIARRVLDSDDDDDSPALQVKDALDRKRNGLEGKVPVAILRINQGSESEGEERSHVAPPSRFLDLEAEDDDSDVSHEYYNARDDSTGSLRDFIVNDDEASESEATSEELELEAEHTDGSALPGPSLRQAWRNRPRPRASQVFVRGKYEDPDDSLGSIRDMLEGDNDAVCDNDSYTPSNPSTPAQRVVTDVVNGPTPTEVIEVLDSSDDEPTKLNDGEIDVSDRQSDWGGESGDGMLHFSPPPRPATLPDLGGLSLADDDETPAPKANKAKKVTKPRTKPELSKKEWEALRVTIADEFFRELDNDVFENRLGAAGVGATLQWSAHLRTSAGNANKKSVRSPDGSKTYVYVIHLSTKILKDKQQIIDTLAHEMCHLAAWVISNELKNPHGKVFKSWGWKVMQARPGVEVTTKHSYEIKRKYSWTCTNTACAQVYQRDSKSIDIERQACGKCRSKLQPNFENRAANPFQCYLKDHMKAAKAAMPSAPHGEVMRALSARWNEDREGDHAAYWRAMSS